MANIRKININEINITIKSLKTFNKRFPSEIFELYSHNNFLNEKNIYKIITKNKKYDKYNIIIIKNINNLLNETVLDIIEEYDDKDIIYVDDYGLQHDNFYNVFNKLNILYFDWSKNKFFYKDRKSGSHLKDNYEKLKLIYYIKHKSDPFLSTPEYNTPSLSILEKETSYFPT